MFWMLKDCDQSAIACHDLSTGLAVTYRELDEAVEALASRLSAGSKKLVFLVLDNSYRSITAYLACLRARQAVLLIDAKTSPELLKTLITVYSPDLLWSQSPIETGTTLYDSWSTAEGFLSRGVPWEGDPINPDLGLLLSTSGTTGSPKLVRLKYANVQANAASIAEYLGLGPAEVAITNLPMHYSYGLSVINSHLLAGAKLVCTNASMFQADFWNSFRSQQCTSFAGVPFTYQMLERMGFERMDLPTLRMMTQAGGRLSVDRIKKFHDVAEKKNIRFFVMYGQTEATARISYVPPSRLGGKIGSIGISIPGGTLDVQHDGVSVEKNGVEGEIVYTGPNVMLGYAESRPCLAKGDETQGVLHTGDIGYRDDDGFFFVTGRTKRFLKIYGLRVNLDEVERMLEPKMGVPVISIGTDDRLLLLLETDQSSLADEAGNTVTKLFHINRPIITAKAMPKLPYTATGKKDYETAKKLL